MWVLCSQDSCATGPAQSHWHCACRETGLSWAQFLYQWHPGNLYHVSGTSSEALLDDSDLEPWILKDRWLLAAAWGGEVGKIVVSGDTETLRLEKLWCGLKNMHGHSTRVWWAVTEGFWFVDTVQESQNEVTGFKPFLHRPIKCLQGKCYSQEFWNQRYLKHDSHCS